ncbi:hypothetical protein LCGC14_1462870 [marine sediment metagenome]|uniref:Uncharacterized protein n=1 Tax=marine sediment metagenome TaxID=412755 RepID=A0A0F9LV41_9ZZZZ
MKETVEQQMRDSDMIFKQITCGDFPDFEIAQEAIALLYIPDMTISRSGISHAFKRLERYYGENKCQPG